LLVERSAFALYKPNSLREVGRDVPEVRRPPLGCVDVADEVAAIARDVEDAASGVDEALEVARDLAPDQVLAVRLPVAESLPVDGLELLTRVHRWDCDPRPARNNGRLAGTGCAESAPSARR